MKTIQRQDDYKNWEKLIQHCDEIEGLTAYERESAKRAFQFLRAEFGETFLDEALAAHHPICQHILNLAPWTRKWIIWFAESIKSLRSQENYVSLLDRLKDAHKFDEGFSVLNAAYKFYKVGFRIAVDPPPGTVEGHGKIPDLKMINGDTGEQLFVEVSILGESMTARDAFQTMQKLHEPIWHSVPFLPYCGRVHKTLSVRHLDDVVKRISEAVEKTRTEGCFQNVVIEGIIELGIAPDSDKEFLQKWAAERGLQVGQFSGPPFDVNEILRTKRRVENEQKQLPHNYPNIVVVRNNSLFLHVHDIRKAISELEEEVYRYPHLLAVVIEGGYIGSGEDVTTMKDQHVFIKKTRDDLLVEQYLILLNRFCDVKVFPDSITKMYNAFRSY